MAMRELSLDEIEWVSGGVQHTDISDGGPASDGTTASIDYAPSVENPDGSYTVSELVITAPSVQALETANLNYDLNFLGDALLPFVEVTGVGSAILYAAEKFSVPAAVVGGGLTVLQSYIYNYDLAQVNKNATAYYAYEFGSTNPYTEKP